MFNGNELADLLASTMLRVIVAVAIVAGAVGFVLARLFAS